MKSTLLEIVMYSASYSVCLKSKINISVAKVVDVVLIEYVIQTFVEIFQV